MMVYTIKNYLKPTDLNGVSNEQIDDHWVLYEGYVNQSNALSKELATLRKRGKGAVALYSDRRRRFGFEYSGMVLHELYFGNLKRGVSLNKKNDFVSDIKEQFGTFKDWQEDFINTGKTRSIGWAICYMDPETGNISNHFIQLHEEGNIPSFAPLLVVDVWEHAYMVDNKAGGRADYITTIMNNISWDIVLKRYNDAKSKMISKR
ncbi:MAG: superoxide dismutase [Proteobacteria bacterium]|nr:superoxide dismutase [Pseudomonadota bacterium]